MYFAFALPFQLPYSVMEKLPQEIEVRPEISYIGGVGTDKGMTFEPFWNALQILSSNVSHNMAQN